MLNNTGSTDKRQIYQQNIPLLYGTTRSLELISIECSNRHQPVKAKRARVALLNVERFVDVSVMSSVPTELRRVNRKRNWKVRMAVDDEGDDTDSLRLPGR